MELGWLIWMDHRYKAWVGWYGYRARVGRYELIKDMKLGWLLWMDHIIIDIKLGWLVLVASMVMSMLLCVFFFHEND